MCHLQVSFLSVCHFKVVFTECVALQLAVSGMCHFHSSFTVVIFLFCSPFSFMAFVAYRFFSWCLPPSSLHISSNIRLQYSFYNFYCPYFFNCLLRVSLLGFLSVYSTYPFQASFMVFSSPNLVIVACVAFSLVFLASFAPK